MAHALALDQSATTFRNMLTAFLAWRRRGSTPRHEHVGGLRGVGFGHPQRLEKLLGRPPHVGDLDSYLNVLWYVKFREQFRLPSSYSGSRETRSATDSAAKVSGLSTAAVVTGKMWRRGGDSGVPSQRVPSRLHPCLTPRLRSPRHLTLSPLVSSIWTADPRSAVSGREYSGSCVEITLVSARLPSQVYSRTVVCGSVLIDAEDSQGVAVDYALDLILRDPG